MRFVWCEGEARPKARKLEKAMRESLLVSSQSAARMVFGRKKSLGAQDSPPPPPLPSKSSVFSGSSKSKRLHYPEPAPGKVHVDDFGRTAGHLPPAFSSAQSSGGNGYGIGEDEFVEASLIYGYTAIETEYECEIEGVLLAVRQIAEEIKTRGTSLVTALRLR